MGQYKTSFRDALRFTQTDTESHFTRKQWRNINDIYLFIFDLKLEQESESTGISLSFCFSLSHNTDALQRHRWTNIQISQK